MQMRKLVVVGCAALALCATLTADAEDRALYNAEHLLAYWPLNSASKVGEEGDDAYYADASGKNRQLVVNGSHVSFVPDPTACDGEYAHMDGNGSYLKSKDKLPLSSCTGLTFFFRIQGARPADPTKTSCGIFEMTEEYNLHNGALTVGTTLQNGKWHLSVAERSSSGWALCWTVAPLPETGWQNVVIVFSKQTAPECFAVYFDGVRQELTVRPASSGYHDKTMATQAYYNDILYIGGRAGAGSVIENLDEFGVYNYAMNADEVVRLTADITGKGGSLQVMSAGGVHGAAQPVIGSHAGYAEGEAVSFSWEDAEVSVRGWTLFDSTDGQWNAVKRGYGRCGTFTHTGGMMRLRWETDDAACRWTFDDGTGRNAGIRGADCDLDISGNASAAGGYLAVPSEAAAFAGTKSRLDLSTASGVAASFWIRSPIRRAAGTMIELSANPNLPENQKGTVISMGYSSETHGYSAFATGDGLKGYSVVNYNPAEVDDVMTDGDWHHLSFVFRKAQWPNIDLYIDGVKMAVTSDGAAGHDLALTGRRFSYDQKMWLCHRGTENTMKADLDNVTIHSRALTAADVATAYLAECEEMGKAAVVPEGFSTLVVTAKKAVPQGELPIPGWGRTSICTEGETLSFDFTRGPYTVEGSAGKYSLTGWTLYRRVEGEWTVFQSGKNPLVEFVHPGGQVKLELKFSSPGLMLMVF